MTPENRRSSLRPDAAGRVAVITPIVEDRAAAVRLFDDLRATLGERAHIVAVDDGSLRDPMRPADLDGRGELLTLPHNRGHQNAIATGLAHVRASLVDVDAVVLMDSDGEDSPSSIPGLLNALRTSDADVAVAQRRGRHRSLRFVACYRAYRMLFRTLTGHSMDFGNFMAMTPDAARRLADAPTTHRHVAATVLICGVRVERVPTHRSPRYSGHSRMNVASLSRHGVRSLLVCLGRSDETPPSPLAAADTGIDTFTQAGTHAG